MNTKPCRTCREVKDMSEFGTDIRRPDGKNYSCRVCNAAYAKAWALANPVKLSAGQAAYRDRRRLERAQQARKEYDKINPGAEFRRAIRAHKHEQLQDAIDFVRENPGTTKKRIVEEAGLTEYLWRMVAPKFALTRVKDSEKSAIRITFTLIDDTIVQPTQETTHESRHSEPHTVSPPVSSTVVHLRRAIPTFRELSGLTHAVAAEPERPAVQRVTVSRFSSEYDD